MMVITDIIYWEDTETSQFLTNMSCSHDNHTQNGWKTILNHCTQEEIQKQYSPFVNK